jgi:hypothetical protein
MPQVVSSLAYPRSGAERCRMQASMPRPSARRATSFRSLSRHPIRLTNGPARCEGQRFSPVPKNYPVDVKFGVIVASTGGAADRAPPGRPQASLGNAGADERRPAASERLDFAATSSSTAAACASWWWSTTAPASALRSSPTPRSPACGSPASSIACSASAASRRPSSATTAPS